MPEIDTALAVAREIACVICPRSGGRGVSYDAVPSQLTAAGPIQKVWLPPCKATEAVTGTVLAFWGGYLIERSDETRRAPESL